MTLAQGGTGDQPPKVSPWNDPRIRGRFYQSITVLVLAVAIAWIWLNALDNLRKLNLAVGFGFLNGRAGFDLGQTLIQYTSDDSYVRAFEVGILNTLLVAALGVVTATILGLLVGMARLSRNWLISRLATAYVEIVRNVPLLVIIFFWYMGVISALPSARESLILPFDMVLNNRGFYFPKPVFGAGSSLAVYGLIIAIVASIAWWRYAWLTQVRTGRQLPVGWVNLALLVGLPLIGLALAGFPLTFDIPVAGKFNISGGSMVGPEFMSLYLALSFYTATYIGEIVRAGIRGVAKGQSEAAFALGLRPGLTTRLIVLPQALRIIIPPLTSQYLNLTKNSSLAVAIGYADFVAVGGTILNQTGHSIEVVAIWMAVYLSVSLATSLFMNWFNSRMALVER